MEEALAKRESYGLAGLRERVALLGGVVRIKSLCRPESRQTGTSIWIELPVPVVAAAAIA